jgi:hypothetical protein
LNDLLLIFFNLQLVQVLQPGLFFQVFLLLHLQALSLLKQKPAVLVPVYSVN